MTEPVRVMIFEDDVATARRMQEKIDLSPRYEVVDMRTGIAQAVEFIAAARPGVLLVDLDLEDGSGLEVIRQQHERQPELPILVISVFGDERSVIKAIEAGARGYLLKSDTSVAMEQCLDQLVEGGAPISAAIAVHLIDRFQKPVARQVPGPGRPDLSARELEVLQLAAKGYKYQDIAVMLGVKVSTISSYTRRTYEKLSVHSKSEAVFEAMRHGLMDGPEAD